MGRTWLRPVALSLAALITLLWGVNFLWTLSLSAQYGGGALNGFVRDGRYYLAQHGSNTEVSQAIWEQIRVHELGIWLGVPFVVVSYGYLLFTFAFPAVMGLRQGGEVNERVQAVRTSGERLAAGRCAGSNAGVSYGWPFLCVEVFPGGLTLCLFLQRPVVIRKEEVRRLTAKWNRYEITHTSPDVMSPVVLTVVFYRDLAAALEALARDLPPAASQTV
jgi:hypothetical protein